MVEETQTLLYRICKCRLLEDENVESTKLVQHQREILELMIGILQREAPAELAKFDQKSLEHTRSQEIFFEIFKIIRLAPELMQSLLEMTNPEKRLVLIKKTLYGGAEVIKKESCKLGIVGDVHAEDRRLENSLNFLKQPRLRQNSVHWGHY